MHKIRHLFIKETHGGSMLSVESMEIGLNGIDGNVLCLPFRQVLIMPVETLIEFGIEPGSLRENIVIDGLDIHSLASGTVLQIGDVRIRLTFHCEPCKVIKNVVSLSKILHKRGVLGTFLTKGIMRRGDLLTVKGVEFESIPYSIGDRIEWYLGTRSSPVYVSQLVHDIGLSQSYCRAIPSIVRRRQDIDDSMILYKSKSQGNSDTPVQLPLLKI